MVQAIRVLFCDNKEAKKKLKESKSRITHCIGYIFIDYYLQKYSGCEFYHQFDIEQQVLTINLIQFH